MSAHASLSVSRAFYRVMACDRDGLVTLISLTPTLPDAITLAEAFCGEESRRRQQADFQPRPGDARTVYLEDWRGGPQQGCWEYLGPRDGGFFQRLGEPYRRRPARRPARKTDNLNGRKSLPNAGDLADCLLLDEQTRKGGWKARLAAGQLSGPIINGKELPETCQGGQMVRLVVAATSSDGKTIQFRWPSNPPAEA